MLLGLPELRRRTAVHLLRKHAPACTDVIEHVLHHLRGVLGCVTDVIDVDLGACASAVGVGHLDPFGQTTLYALVIDVVIRRVISVHVHPHRHGVGILCFCRGTLLWLLPL